MPGKNVLPMLAVQGNTFEMAKSSACHGSFKRSLAFLGASENRWLEPLTLIIAPPNSSDGKFKLGFERIFNCFFLKLESWLPFFREWHQKTARLRSKQVEFHFIGMQSRCPTGRFVRSRKSLACKKASALKIVASDTWKKMNILKMVGTHFPPPSLLL